MQSITSRPPVYAARALSTTDDSRQKPPTKRRLSITGIVRIALVFTLCTFIQLPNAHAESLDQETHNTIVKKLASEDDDQILEAVKEITESTDNSYYDLLTSLYRGKLYIFEDREEIDSGLVIGGDEIDTDEGDTLLPISSIRPMQPINDAGGKQLTIDVFDLIEVESNRALREMIQIYQSRTELNSGDPKERMLAIERMGEGGDTALIPILEAARETTKELPILRAIDIAVNRLRITSDDALTRYKAVESFEELHATELIPLLQSRIAAGEDGAAPIEQDARVTARTKATILALEDWERSMTIVQTIFSGISLGSVLVLIGLGLAIIYGLMGVINMAHGEFLMVGAYTTFVVQTQFLKFAPPQYFDLFFVLSLPAAFIIAGIVGLIVESLVIKHLYSRPLESLLATWGISLLLIQAARRIFGDLTAVQTPSFLSGGFVLFPQVILPYGRLFIMGLTVATVVGLYIVFYRTRFGMRIRAVTQNRNMSACLGIPTRRIDSLAFFLGSGLAGLAGCAITLVGNVVPNMGQSYIVDAFLVVVVGGVGKLIGCVVSGMGIGFLTKMFEPVFQAVYGKVLILGLVILFLQHKPTGLFPAKGRNND